jgi:hypothetical protein
MKKNTLIAIALILCSGCASYKDTFPAYANANVKMAEANATVGVAYYNLLSEKIKADAEIKKAALERKDSGGTVIFIGSDGFQNIGQIHKQVEIQAPDSAPGAKYAVSAFKTLAYGATAVLLGHEIFDTIENISGTVSNVSNTVTNTNANQANKTVSVSDSGNSSTDNSNSGNSSTDNSNSGNTEDNSKAVTVSDSLNKTDNSVTSTDTRAVTFTNSLNTTDSSDQSNNSDNSDNSTHDNDNSTTENILPEEPAVTE